MPWAAIKFIVRTINGSAFLVLAQVVGAVYRSSVLSTCRMISAHFQGRSSKLDQSSCKIFH